MELEPNGKHQNRAETLFYRAKIQPQDSGTVILDAKSFIM